MDKQPTNSQVFSLIPAMLQSDMLYMAGLKETPNKKEVYLYGIKYHKVSVNIANFFEAEDWCKEKFGDFSNPKKLNEENFWFSTVGVLYLKNEKDAIWARLKWGC